MVGWLSNPPRSMSKIADVGSKSYQVGAQNPLKSVPRGLLEGSWGILGGSWDHLGSKRASRAQKVARRTPNEPPWTPQVGAPNRSKIDLETIQKVIIFVDRCLDRFLKRFGTILAPTWLPKPSQNPPKTKKNYVKSNHFLITFYIDF